MKTTYQKPVLDLTATGAKIKSIMKLRGVSPRQVQIILNFPFVQTIYNWFSGKNMPSIDNLIVLSEILEVSINDLLVTNTVEIEI
ncbi:MAG: helix-turn-helix transcriptional regulator [Spirochaetaceae bacterium]|nr:helix-turn-helix transcriptional regulator [Spirochaetaceae bacterium]MBQ3024374.1 helix-turn-helix transcriptional regulator [Spirochaetaceae bacterium]